jgi:spermidine export protein MdtI
MELNIMSDGTIGTLLIICSVFFDVLANICLKKSQGFKYKLYGFLAISLVGFAFLCLAYAISIMDLSIAYAIWCAIGIVAATLISVFLFNEALSPAGYFAIALIVAGVIILNLFGPVH